MLGLVEHAVGVGDVVVEGVVPVPAAERQEHNIEPTVRVVSVHSVVAYGSGDLNIEKE